MHFGIKLRDLYNARDLKIKGYKIEVALYYI